MDSKVLELLNHHLNHLTTYSNYRQTVLWGIFITYFATCSCYTVIIARNILYVTDQYYGENSFNVRYVVALLLVPLVLLAFVPNLKYLAPVSMVANVCMALGLGITFYYLVKDVPPPSERPAVANDLSTLPICISVVIFAIEAIGVVSFGLGKLVEDYVVNLLL